MATSQLHITPNTRMGATLIEGGATFRVWAPRAQAVYVIIDELTSARLPGWSPRERDALVQHADGTWTGFVPDIVDGMPYRFWVIGEGGAGFKRDPYARELGTDPPFPDCDCLVRDAHSYPWHDHAYRPPRFRDLVIYQLHIGVFYATDEHGQDVREQQRGGFLDFIERIEYLRDLGVNAIQPLPVQEYPSQFSMGYNGTDYFSPEMDYQVESESRLSRALVHANAMLANHGHGPLTLEQLRAGPNQLKLLVDLCHLNGIAVIFDLVYNHAGGGFDDQSIYFFDRAVGPSNRESLYFTDRGWAGGLVFDYAKPFVRAFLIDNAKFFLDEYHIDGMRYDEVSVIDNHGGWSFCQDLTSTARSVEPTALQIAEYWSDHRWLAVIRPPEGMGFDAALGDGLRDRLRDAIGDAAGGAHADVNLHAVAAALETPFRFPAAWTAVQSVENHDIAYEDRPPHEWKPRLARLADPSNSRSWYARSRARVANALLLTAPGVPMLFMGQEFLEDKNWSDNPEFSENTLIWWDGLSADAAMHDHLRFMRDLIRLRHEHGALRDEETHAYHVNAAGRVVAYQRWIEGTGQDVVIVASLNESTFWSYDLGFPRSGRWREVFNSDYYDGFPNDDVAGNGGGIDVTGPPLHGLPASTTIVIPANGVVVFA